MRRLPENSVLRRGLSPENRRNPFCIYQMQNVVALGVQLESNMANKKTSLKFHHARRMQREKKHSWRDRSESRRNSYRARRSQRLSARQQEAKLRCVEAVGLYQSGKVKSAFAAARKAGTTLPTMKRLVPAAITQDHPGGRIRIKASDPYSAPVEILTNSGAAVATARGSRQRQLAGQHRATCFRVLRKKAPPSALDQYRGKKVGGYELLSDYEQLRVLARAGVLGQLDTLYVSPDVSV